MAIRSGDIYRAAVEWRMANQICYNVLHFRSLSDAADIQVPSRLAEIVAAVSNFTENAVAAASHESVEYLTLTVSFAWGLGAPHFVVEDLEFPGEQSGELLPGLTALTIHLLTGLGGRSNRGRFHWGGLTEAIQDAGVLTAGGVTLRDAIMSVMMSQLQGQTFNWSWVVFSRKQTSDNWPPPDAAAWANQSPQDNRTIISVSSGDIIGSMYSRKIGVGS